MKISKHITIGAVIPTFNRKAILKQCLEVLNAQVAGSVQFSLTPIVVVDGSTDGSVEMIRQNFHDAQIVNGTGSWWYTRSINEGIKIALQLNVDFILTLNDDIYFDSNYVATLLNDYFSKPVGSIVGSASLSDSLPRLITFSGVKKIDTLLKEYYYYPKFSTSPGNLSGVRPSLVLSGRGILYPIEIIRRFGLYDEKLVQYKSETDYTFNAYKNGVPVFISFNAMVYEHVSLTSADATYNNPTFRNFWNGLFNPYSINSVNKTFYYSIKHKGYLAGVLVSLVRIGGLFKRFLKIKLKS